MGENGRERGEEESGRDGSDGAGDVTRPEPHENGRSSEKGESAGTGEGEIELEVVPGAENRMPLPGDVGNVPSRAKATEVGHGRRRDASERCIVLLEERPVAVEEGLVRSQPAEAGGDMYRFVDGLIEGGVREHDPEDTEGDADGESKDGVAGCAGHGY